MTTISPAPTPRRRSRWLLAGAIGAAVLALAAMALVKLASSPNATVRLHLPPRLDAFTERDGVAFPLHAALGTGLNLARGPAEAAAIQWLKAAAHARSQDELATAVGGLRAARGRAADPVAFAVEVCGVTDRAEPQMLLAAEEAGLGCKTQR